MLQKAKKKKFQHSKEPADDCRISNIYDRQIGNVKVNW